MTGARRPWLIGGVVLLSLAALFLYLRHVPGHPPGFYIDESSIAYNAHTISRSGADEYGNKWPLFFRAFGEYKNPVFIYLLAGVYSVTGPSIAAARALASILGWLPGLLLTWLAWKISRQWLVAALIAASTWLTPWLFEDTRLALEVVTYPGLIALLLLMTWQSPADGQWSWKRVAGLAAALTLLTYSYSIGRLLGPLLALGLCFFITKERWLRVFTAWGLYAILVVPLALFHQTYPGALTGRFNELSYFHTSGSLGAALVEFVHRYAVNVNPWRWLVTGEHNVRDHLAGTGSLLVVTVLLGLVGLGLIARQHYRHAWWRFVLYGLLVSVVPAALTRNDFPQLRLIAFPVFFLAITIPALSWLVGPRQETTRGAARIRPLAIAAVAILTLAQGLNFQRLYHRNAPSLWYVYDARFPRKVLKPAVQTGAKPIYLFDEPGKSGYIQALWHGVLAGLPPDQFVRLSPKTPPPAGSVVISTEEDCHNCQLLARSLNYIVYSIPPHSEPGPIAGRSLTEFRASIVVENAPVTLGASETRALSVLVRNTSTVEWPALGDPSGAYAVSIGARWRHSAGRVVRGDTHKRLPYDLEPGDTAGVILEVTAPADSGDYVLEIDAVQERVAWFSERGSPSMLLNLKVQ